MCVCVCVIVVMGVFVGVRCVWRNAVELSERREQVGGNASEEKVVLCTSCELLPMAAL